MIRPTWDETWMEMATAMSKRSRCVNRQVGCVIVTSENRPMAVGYNGPPANYNTPTIGSYVLGFVQEESGCDSFCERGSSKGRHRGESYHNCVSVHAEANALLFADRRDYAGGTMYVTNPCCWECAKLVANSGINRLVVRITEKDAHADTKTPLNFIKSCGVQVYVV